MTFGRQSTNGLQERFKINMKCSTQHRFFLCDVQLDTDCTFPFCDSRHVSCFSTSWESKCAMVVSVGCVRCFKWNVPSQVCGVSLVFVSIRKRNLPTATQLNSVLEVSDARQLVVSVFHNLFGLPEWSVVSFAVVDSDWSIKNETKERDNIGRSNRVRTSRHFTYLK